MTVYVDEALHPFGGMVMCHMFSPDLDDLLAMADRIGVDRKWVQGHPELSLGKNREASWVHFDISQEKRALALEHGAIACDRYQTAAMAAIIRGELDPLRLIRPLADATKAFAPAAHVANWLAQQGFPY